MFGCIPSVGLYDRLARLVVWFALSISCYPRKLTIQHLDDLCIVGEEKLLRGFYDTYRLICSEVGISLADDSDPDKAFGPCTKGVLLGVCFDTVSWTFSIPKEKIDRYVNDIVALLQTAEAELVMVQSTVGKIMYVAPLVPGGKYHLSEDIKASVGDKPKDIVVFNEGFRRQLEWWMSMLLICQDMPIPSGDEGVAPPWAVICDTDPAGSSLIEGGRGCGAVLGQAWVLLSWPQYINSKKVATCCGSKWRHKLSFLEMLGHMLHLTSFAKEVHGTTEVMQIDNSGTVVLLRKCYDVKCPITDTLIRACDYVAKALRMKAFVRKVTRCSTVGAAAADALSKSDMKRFWNLMPGAEVEPRSLSRSFRFWLECLTTDWDLGKRIVEDLRETVNDLTL